MTKRWMWATAAAVLATQGAAAWAAPTVEECRAIADREQRLACYDEVPVATPASPAPVSAAPASAAAAIPAQTSAERQTAAEQNFGLAANQVRTEPERVTAKIVEMRPGRKGPLLVLDNGHEWQVTTDRNLADRLRVGQTVEIKRGMMSGYRVYVDGVTGMETVQRIK